jgi:hypothetical protein
MTEISFDIIVALLGLPVLCVKTPGRGPKESPVAVDLLQLFE